MTKIRISAALLLLGFLQAAPARADDYLTCQTPDRIKVCPGDVRLRTGQVLGSLYLPVIPLTKGGFGVNVSTGLTNGHVAIVSGGAITIGPLSAGALPAALTATSVTSGGTLTLNGTTEILAQANGNTVLTLAIGGATFAQPVVATQGIGISPAAIHALPTGTAELVAADTPLLVQPLLIGSTDYVSNWFNTQVIGPFGVTIGAQSTNTIPAVAPYDSKLLGVVVQVLNPPASNTVLTVERSAKGAPAFAPLAATITCNTGVYECEWSGSINLTKGDQLQLATDTSWTGSGATIMGRIQAR